ncbi:Valyl-tRNA synthetase, partial [hydrothermal vent metagenome]
GLKFMGDVPFREVYIHGLVRDAHGNKMSKSKGNVIDPIDLIDGIDLESLVEKRAGSMMQPHLAEKIAKQTRKDFPNGIPSFGTDALRFTFAAMASTGRDINFDLNRIEGYRNFCNKLWNAARYVLMNTEEKDCGQNGGETALSSADRWILSRLQQTEQQVIDNIQNYRLDLAAQAIYSFIWDEYCDWYLELSKAVLTSENTAETALRGTRQTLVQVLETILRLAHPIIPFITEEIWQRVAPLAGVEGETIMRQPYPQPDEMRIDEPAMAEIDWVKQFVLGVRKIRSGMNIDPRKPLPVLLQNGSTTDQQRLEANRDFVTSLGRVESIEWLGEQEDPESATALVGEMKVLIPMAGLIDKEAEQARLNKELDRKHNELERTEKKLGNASFVDKAPAAVVEKEKNKLEDIRTTIRQLEEQLEKIAKLR